MVLCRYVLYVLETNIHPGGPQFDVSCYFHKISRLTDQFVCKSSPRANAQQKQNNDCETAVLGVVLADSWQETAGRSNAGGTVMQTAFRELPPGSFHFPSHLTTL
jgi:hypothetical protein